MPQDADKPQRKTRRRLRVSCVECTRRRQKCDRAQPCGLCKRRGVEHLCRWELEPFARPPPSRPHASRKAENRTLSEVRTHTQSQVGKRGGGPNRGIHSREANLALEHEVKEAAIALAQLSVARHGEYLGTGSLVCALHRLNDSSEAKIPIDKSSGLPFSTRSQYSSAVSNTFLSTLQTLVSDFPDRSRCETLLASFFEHDNWRFGLPQTLIVSVHHSMWDTVATDKRALERLNFNWVTFLFAMFALSSGCSSEQESRKYFLQALTAKRLAEDVQYASFFTPRDSGTFSQGTAHGCIAAALMAEYMCDRGQLTEAWKLAGCAVRDAQNVGLHLNPAWSKWKGMTKDEQTLRRLGWHMCAAKDRFLSFALGRPSMVRSCEYYVPFPDTCPPSLASDGTSDTTCSYLGCLIRLIEIVAEEKDKHLCINPDPHENTKTFQSKMSAWEASLPAYFVLRDPEATFDQFYPRLRIQRCLLACYYHFSCMFFCRSLSCVKHLDELSDTPPRYKNNWDFNQLTQCAIDLLHAQRSLLVIMERQRQVFFAATYFIFEAAVTLGIAICRDRDNAKVEEWRKELSAAIDLLQSLLSMDNGELTQQAIVVLRIIQDRRPRVSDAPTPEDTSIEIPRSSWPLIDPQSAAFSSMLSEESLRTEDPALGFEQSYGDPSSGFSFSGFDFLFNTVTS